MNCAHVLVLATRCSSVRVPRSRHVDYGRCCRGATRVHAPRQNIHVNWLADSHALSSEMVLGVAVSSRYVHS
jgi:hypothetical protein